MHILVCEKNRQLYFKFDTNCNAELRCGGGGAGGAFIKNVYRTSDKQTENA